MIESILNFGKKEIDIKQFQYLVNQALNLRISIHFTNLVRSDQPLSLSLSPRQWFILQ